MNMFWTQNRALETTSLGRVQMGSLVGSGGSQLFSTVGPKSGSVGPGGYKLFIYVGPKSGSVGCGGTRWVPALLYVKPDTPYWVI